MWDRTSGQNTVYVEDSIFCIYTHTYIYNGGE